MNRRRKQVHDEFLNNEEEVIKRLEEAYKTALADIKAKMQELEFSIGDLKQQYEWLDVDDPERERIKSIIQSKIYQKQYQEVLQRQLEGILNELHLREFATVSDYLDTCYTDGFLGTIFDFHGQDVPFMLPLDQQAMIDAIQINSKISVDLYTHMGLDIDRFKREIASEITRGIATGASWSDVAKHLDDRARVGFNNAVRIARTEGHRVQCNASMDAAYGARDRGADVLKQWDAALDARTRESHAKIDMEIKELDEKFSNGLMFPGDPNGKAAEVVNCRCSLDQRARWALEGGFNKMNNFTKEIETFDSLEDYNEFKKAFFSKENRAFMDFTEAMEKQYKTKDFNKILDKMSEAEYKRYTRILNNNPIYHKNASNNRQTAKTSAKSSTTHTRKELDTMSLEQLRKIAKETAIKYYESGTTGISFGGASPEHVAEALANQGTKSSLIKDILAMQKRMNNKG